MKLIKKITLSAITVALLAGCQTKPGSSTQVAKVSNRASNAQVAKSAYDFKDHDITIPAYFDTQGLERCTFDVNNETDSCPLKKPIVRMYFDLAQVTGSGIGVDAMREFDNNNLLLMVENQFAGINRFRIITRDDDTISKEQQIFLQQQGAKAAAKRAEVKALMPDFIVKIDSLRTIKTEGAYSDWADYTLELTTGVINPQTREKLSHPNLGKIRVKSEDVRERSELQFTRLSGRYYTGFHYDDSAHVNAVFNDMGSRGIDILLTRMLSEMPATAQVLGIKGNKISLDRGQNAGVLPNETMIIFSYEAGFVEPLGVANVNPSRNSANGEIIRWKDSNMADNVKNKAENGIYRPASGAKIFAVSVGTPANFLESRT
ncbi:hypothetical protein P20311_0280 [Pseudoalteromonas sp. BSi20311]|jgi:hypothetical protein|uniref:hypothetical protein n=1 Tax=Pseudoalteromonas sp. BSi20311 TaxID=383911 RepID=UPI000231970C|nr:hypothetical protein [Pseudoalteromonas sp. BSi20311]GAA62507.1 hypothetical protein P20311_0280 [Pseudoalteromonas sp. BSi20311]HCP96560.1 hypothetical protein [Pseudoalteromonas sp.]